MPQLITTPPGVTQQSTDSRSATKLHDTITRVADGGPSAINDRLEQLDREWSVGRSVKAVSGIFILAGLGLALAVNPWFYVIPVVGGLCLAQYAFARKSVLGDLFQSMGFRAGTAIEDEKLALRTLRGDFRNLPTVHEIVDHDAVSRMEGEGGITVEETAAAPKPELHEAVREVVHAVKQ